MAKAQINKMVIETPVQVTVTQMKTEEKQTGVRLDLTMAEAETLRVLVGAMHGSTVNSPTKYALRIYDALKAAGVAYEPDHYRITGHLGFMDYPKDTKVAPVDPLKGEPEDGAGFTGCNTTKPALKTGDIIEFLRKYAGGIAKQGDRAVVGHKESESSFLFTAKNGEKYWVGPEGIGDAFKIVQAEPAPALPTIFQVGDVVLVNKQLTVVNRGERAKITSLGQTGGYFLSTIGCHTKKGFAQGEDLTLVTAAHPLSNL